jgi:hypothetical protein
LYPYQLELGHKSNYRSRTSTLAGLYGGAGKVKIHTCLSTGFLFVCASFTFGTAWADITESVSETFQSGATFNGTVTFLNDYSNLTGVNGILSGGTGVGAGGLGYGNDAITWVFYPPSNYGSSFGPQYGGNFLMDGPPCSLANVAAANCSTFTNFISFTWDYSGAPNLVFASPGGVLGDPGGNSVSYSDALVSGTIGPAEVTPEPTYFAAMLLCLGVVLGLRQRAAAAARA